MAAIRAYDKIVWTVGSGFSTLVFDGRSNVIKAAIETNSRYKRIAKYIIMLCAFSVVLAVAGGNKRNNPANA